MLYPALVAVNRTGETGEPSQRAQRVALVTGASSGIGAATALALADCGHKVAIGARSSGPLEEVARQLEARGVEAFAQVLDVADGPSIQPFYQAAEKALGPVDLIVSNAGTCRPGLLHETKDGDLELEVATNLLGPMLLARCAVRRMLADGRSGDIVFISSENAVVPRTFQSGYTATKMGLEGLARVLRMELEGTGIRATIVRPGPTNTRFGRGWDPGLLQRLLASWKYWGVQRHMNWMPAESVAAAVVAAVSAPAGTHMDVLQVMPEGPRADAD
jgi:NAD(P)-dependent dehydrogenase (short-subunit alcohol dehydrogenase family)